MSPFTKEQIEEHLKDTTISEDEREFYEAMLNAWQRYMVRLETELNKD